MSASVFPTSRRAGLPARWKPWAAAGAVLLLGILALDTMGLFRPVPSGPEVVAAVRRAWSGVDGYEAVVMVGGQATAGSTGRASVRWSRAGYQGLSSADLAGFMHSEVLRGDRREYYQPGAEILANIRYPGIDRLPYGAWQVTGFPGLQDLVRVLAEAERVDVLGRMVQDGREQLALQVQPRMPEAARGTTGLDAEFFEARFGALWTVGIALDTWLPTGARVQGVSGSTGWSVDLAAVKLNPRHTEADWRLPVRDGARRIRLVCRTGEPGAIYQVSQQLDRELRAWKSRMVRAPADP